MDSMSIARASLTKAAAITSWVAQITAAVILGQTLFFKFTGAPESKYIFSTLGIEPWGRIGTGVLELITVILLLNPKTPVLGAVLAVGLMGGAIMSHLTRLGIEVQGDHGLLFKLGVTVLVAALVVLFVRRRELPIIGDRF
jgi:putative oxidoreductase